MLQQICEHIHNYFIKASHRGSYEIKDGTISLPFVKEGQRILIVGSDLNDGIYTYHSHDIKDDDDVEEVGLRDEVFSGSICALAVPPAVIALTEEISQWVEKYDEVMKSPYSSESVIGVYSYEKMALSKIAGGNPMVTWQDVFKNKLDRWRKVSF